MFKITPPQQIAVAAQQPQQMAAAQMVAQRLGLALVDPQSDSYPYLLMLTPDHIELCKCNSNEKPLVVDFLSPMSTHRRLQGGGSGQLIAKAVGIKKQYRPDVLDLSAGLGRDAFVLASLGCQVMMVERSPILAIMLEDGLKRLSQHENLPLQLCHRDSKEYIQQLVPETLPDVIYLDPMFPGRQKTALVKKEMRILRDIVGEDSDAPQLLALALNRAKKRVVVKRPKLAETLISEPMPDVVYSGKSSRFDVYIPGC